MISRKNKIVMCDNTTTSVSNQLPCLCRSLAFHFKNKRLARRHLKPSSCASASRIAAAACLYAHRFNAPDESSLSPRESSTKRVVLPLNENPHAYSCLCAFFDPILLPLLGKPASSTYGLSACAIRPLFDSLVWVFPTSGLIGLAVTLGHSQASPARSPP